MKPEPTIPSIPSTVFTPIVAGLAIVLAVKGQAQEPALEEVHVTATKRDTTLIESDLSATVIGARDIEEARVRDFRRIDELVPNVQFSESGQGGSIFITVRGVESNPFIVNRAAVYIDGVPFRELSNSVLNQVESVEVLRGPQGTLYGANSESGLIIVNTKAPGQETEISARLTGTSFDSGGGMEMDAFASGPLVDDSLAGSVAVKVAREDAFVKNLGTSTGETGQIEQAFLRGRLRWTPTERLTVNATAYRLELDAPGVFKQQYVPLDLDSYNALYADTHNGGRRAGKWSTYEDAPKYTTEEEIVTGLSATYDLDYGSLDFAASYRQVEEDSRGLDFDLTAAPFVAGMEIQDEHFRNAELRFSSPEGDRFDYILGFSYYEEQERRTQSTMMGEGGLEDYSPAPTQREGGQDLSAFASANWHAAEKLKFGAGLRYEQAERRTRQRAGEMDLGFGSVITYQDAKLSKEFDVLLPRVSAVYTFTRDFSVHSSVARGYIPGGFNLTAYQDGIVDDSILTYDSETLWSREVGFKWRSSKRKLSASGAIFYITSDNWQEIQVATDESGRPVSSDYIGSDASIRSRGLELEGRWQASEAFSVRAHFGYVDARYRDLQIEENLNLSGERVQFVPNYDAGLALRYQWPLGVYVRTEAGFTGKMPLRALGDVEQEAATIFGLQVGYEGEMFSARLFAENLTDERRGAGLAIDNLAFGSDGLYYAPLDAPRVVGLELEANL